MAEHHKHTAHIKRKGLDTTGVTEDHARNMASTLGSHTLMIVEARHDTVTTDAEGKQSAALVLTQVEPVPDTMEDAVRELMRALYRQRPDVMGQAALSGTADGPSPADALAQATAQIERDPDGSPSGIWDGNPDESDPSTDEADPGAELCDYPGCVLLEHDGDHDVPAAADEAAASDGNVVAFSGSKS
jgi:hypothetical protein